MVAAPLMNFYISLYTVEWLSGSGTGLNWLYNMHMSYIYIYQYIICTCFAHTCIRIPEHGCMCTHTNIHTHRHTQCDNQTQWFQWERTMKHHLHLETLTWMKPTTQTWPANHQKHDPQITQTSLQSYLQKCFQNIIQHPFHDFKPALCSCTRRQGAASSQQQLFLAWMQSMGRRQVREIRQKKTA